MAVGEDEQRQYRDADHDGDFAPDELQVRAQRRDQGAKAEDQGDIADVGADHVADRDGTGAGLGGLHAHHHFRTAGAKRDHGQPDDQRREAEAKGETRTAFHQRFRAEIQGNQSKAEADPFVHVSEE